MTASTLGVVEIKAFVPAHDFAVSQAFYQALGFTLASSGAGVAYLHCGNASFLLQDFYEPAHANNFMMHLLVEDINDWWQRVNNSNVVERFGVRLTPPCEQPWAMIDFTLTDPSGVLWRIGQNIAQKP